MIELATAMTKRNDPLTESPDEWIICMRVKDIE